MDDFIHADAALSGVAKCFAGKLQHNATERAG
jgi:hypothetical protein